MKSIQYMGSKGNLLDFLECSLEDFVGENSYRVFHDAFCGSGRVAFHFKDKYQVIASDKQLFSEVLVGGYLCNKYPKEHYIPLIEHLNSLNPEYFEKTDKFFSRTYGGAYNDGVSIGEDGKPKIWLDKNAQKIDMVRFRIDEMTSEGEIDQTERAVLLLSLMLAVNQRSNVVGHQNGYLKRWADVALKDICFEIPPIGICDKEHKILIGDIFDIIGQVESDVAYFDPPYGTSNKAVSVSTVGRYSVFYHLWNTLIENSRPEVWGKANKPLAVKDYTGELEINIREKVFPKFVELFSQARTKVLMVSYSNQGLLSYRDFVEVFRLSGCDMTSFRVYCCYHKRNNQESLARKEGKYINVEQDLMEFLFLANKSEMPQVSSDSIEAWLKKPQDVSFPSVYSLFLNGKFFSAEEHKEIELGTYECSVEMSLESLLGWEK